MQHCYALFTYLISAMVNLKIIVQIIPRMSFSFVSTISTNKIYVNVRSHSSLHMFRLNQPSAPIFVNATPLNLINSKALFTFSTFWILILGFLLYLPNGVSPIISYRDIRISCHADTFELCHLPRAGSI
jgi:hypothetical protein